MTDLGPILRQLRALPPNELKEVRQKMGVWDKLGGGSTTSRGSQARDTSLGDDYLLAGIQTELRRRGLLGSDARISVRALPSGFQERSESVRHQLEGRARAALTTPERIALGRTAGRALADYLESINIPVTRNSMLSRVGLIPQAIDASFPGYLAAGLLHFCW